MTADEQKEPINVSPEGDRLSGEEGRARATGGDEFEREMQREIDRLRRLVNDGLKAIESKLKNRHAS